MTINILASLFVRLFVDGMCSEKTFCLSFFYIAGPGVLTIEWFAKFRWIRLFPGGWAAEKLIIAVINGKLLKRSRNYVYTTIRYYPPTSYPIFTKCRKYVLLEVSGIWKTKLAWHSMVSAFIHTRFTESSWSLFLCQTRSCGICEFLKRKTQKALITRFFWHLMSDIRQIAILESLLNRQACQPATNSNPYFEIPFKLISYIFQTYI